MSPQRHSPGRDGYPPSERDLEQLRQYIADQQRDLLDGVPAAARRDRERLALPEPLPELYAALAVERMLERGRKVEAWMRETGRPRRDYPG